MRRVFMTFALLLVLGATFVYADPQGLREPGFPGAGAGEGDLMTVSVPGVGALIGKAAIASMVMASIYR
jgi:hypothetical protein